MSVAPIESRAERAPEGLGLRARLVGIVVVVLSVLFAACAIIAVVRAESALLEVDEGRARAATKQLASQVAYGTLARSEALLEPSVEAFTQDPALLKVEIVDDKGEVFLKRAGRATDGPILVVRTPIETRTQAPGDVDDELGEFGIGTESDTPKKVGEVVATFSRATAKEIQRRLTRELLFVFLTLGGVGLLVVLFIASGVVRRVRALGKGAARVAAGHEGVVVEDRGSDELSLLSRDFNAMARSLEEQRTKLDDAATALAERESLAGIGRATAVIAHELKNPLGIVLGAARILESDKKSPEAKAKAARIISEETRRLDATLKGLLDYARPKPVKKGRVDIVECLQDVARRSTLPGGPAEEGVVTVADSAPLFAAADEQQLSQTVWNLVQNAMQAGAETVVLTPSEIGRQVKIVVEDDGSGIADDVVKTLFSPFATTKQRGAGLGLAGARRMMRSVGGDLVLKAGQGPSGGAQFLITLEAAPAAASGAVA